MPEAGDCKVAVVGDVTDDDVKYKIEINRRAAILNRRIAGVSPAAIISSRISFYK